MSAEAWNNVQSASFKISKNGVRNSYFVKIKTFRLQTSKLLGNRRKTYILDITYLDRSLHITHFGGESSGKSYRPVQSEGHIFQHLEQKVYLSISDLFRKKNKQGG